MERRRLLLAAGVMLSTGIAGCTDDETGDGGDTADDATGDATETTDEPSGDGTGDKTNDETADGASETGEESTEQVADQPQIISVTGTVEDQTVTDVELVVTKAAGSGDIDIEAVRLQMVGPNGAGEFVHRTVATADENAFTHEPIRDIDDTDPIISDRGDRFQLRFGLGGETAHPPLEAGDTAELELTTSSGARSMVVLSVPTSLAGEDAVEL